MEHVSITPLVFSATGGMGLVALITYRRIASLLAEKRAQPYSWTIGWLQCVLNFSLIPSEHPVHLRCTLCQTQPMPFHGCHNHAQGRGGQNPQLLIKLFPTIYVSSFHCFTHYFVFACMCICLQYVLIVLKNNRKEKFRHGNG